MSFSFSQLHPSLARATQDMGFTKPTPVQLGAIPPGLEGRDILACAMTGSGKTAAFLIPILERLLASKPGRRETRALVISPTRELAAQIVDHFNELAKHTSLRAMAVYGGVGMRPQEQAFRRGIEVIVACPGRLLDHFQYPYARLESLEVLVLDEADRMLDMGFLPDIKRVLNHLPPLNQRLLFSATMPRPIAELSGTLLENPFRLDVERPSAPATKVEQAIFSVSHPKKPALLLALLERNEIGNALVFTRTKHRADRLASALSKQGVPCDCIHGNRSQAQRTRALDGFRSGRTRVLVATDIAARGIDVEALSHVVNFDIPHQVEDYIHRVGRTARAEASGQAFTFVSSHEHATLRAIESAVGRLPRRELEGFDEDAPVAGLWTPVSPGQQQQTRGPRGARRDGQSSDADRGRGGRGPARRPNNKPTAATHRAASAGRDNPRHERKQPSRSAGNRSFEGNRGANQQDRNERDTQRHRQDSGLDRRPQSQQTRGRDDGRRENQGQRNAGRRNAGRPQQGRNEQGRNEQRRNERRPQDNRQIQTQDDRGRRDDRRPATSSGAPNRAYQGRTSQGRSNQQRPQRDDGNQDTSNRGSSGRGRSHQEQASQHSRGRRPEGQGPRSRGPRSQGPGHRGSDRRNSGPHSQTRRGSLTRGADGSLMEQPRNEHSEVEVFRAGQPQTTAFAQFERQGGKAPRKRRKSGTRTRG